MCRTFLAPAAAGDFDPNVETAFVMEIHRGLKRTVHDSAATIGFCGAPFTLATYAIEGGPSKSFAAVKTLMHREPKVLDALLGKLADACGKYLAAQIEAGVLSIDWKLPLDEARRRANGKALQGNVDPGVLLGTPEGVREAVFAARRAAGPTGHIVNLGHGILPPTPPENVAAFVEAARNPLR